MPSPDSAQARSKRLRTGRMAAMREAGGAGPAPPPADLLAPAPAAEEAREEVFLNEDLMKLIFSHLSLEDLCRAGIVRRRWRDVTNNPSFWRVIDLDGKALAVGKVKILLQKHRGVYTLRARKIPFWMEDLPEVLPGLISLRSLELEKGGYDERELEALSRLPQLTRLVLAGGFVGSNHPVAMHWGQQPAQQQDVAVLQHAGLQQLVLEGGRTGRLAIRTPQLASLEVRDFMWGQLHLQGAVSLASISMLECGKLADSALRSLLSVEGPQAAPLPALTSLRVFNSHHLSDETLRLVGQRHPALASLRVEACPAVTGSGLATNGGYAALQHLWLEGCELINGANLAASVHGMPSLESLTILVCAQMSGLSLHCSQLTRLCLQGNRGLQELTLRCPRLAQVELSPPAPGMAASHVLRRIWLASYAVESLQWAAFPALEDVKLQCPNLLELDLSECTLLRDSVFDSLGPGTGVPGFAADGVSPGCPRLRLLKLTDCDSLRRAALSSPSLESLQLSHCARLHSADLDCPALHRLGLEECTQLESVRLATQRMASMSLGTCPRLESITVRSPSLDTLDLRGCNSLQRLQLECPALRKIDATFCGSLPDSAMSSVARCPALEDLTLAVCNNLTAQGLVALSALHNLRALDLSYMPIEDPRPIYAACRQLTSLTISNNYLLNPAHLRDLLPPPPAEAGAAARAGDSAGAGGSAAAAQGGRGPLRSLASLDVSYCEVPSDVLEDLIVQGGRQLECLTISGCSGVTDGLMLRLHRRAVAGRSTGCGSNGSGSDSGSTGCGSSCYEGGATALRTLAMVGSKALRHVHLGLMPAELAAAQGCPGRPRPRGLLAAAQPEVAERAEAGRRLGLAGEPDGPSSCGAGPGAETTEAECEAFMPLVVAPEAGPEAGVEYVAVDTALPALEELRIGLTGVRTVAIGLPSLTRLQLFNCSELRHLELDCPRLERLSVQACKRISIDALVAVLRSGCPALRELDVQYFSGLDQSAVPRLRAACPTLQHVYVTAPQRC